jgi:hypothetical protein
MNARLLILTLLAAITLPSHSQDAPTSQWRQSNLSLFDLVQQGYSIVAVTSDPPRKGSSQEIFFLQKSGSVFKCVEMHDNDIRAMTFEAFFDCWGLVHPYAAHSK